jgi:hypothetical protein
MRFEHQFLRQHRQRRDDVPPGIQKREFIDTGDATGTTGVRG